MHKILLRSIVIIFAGILVTLILAITARFITQNLVRYSSNRDLVIDQLEKLTINGVDQWIYSRGQSKENPVLLFLHGGPGLPMMPHAREWTNLEKHYIVVHWDQRGAGKSFTPNTPSLNFSQVTKDALWLTDHLKAKFSKNKIYLLGYSTGSIIGLHLVAKYPEHFAYYIGLCQITHLVNSDRLSFDWVKRQALDRKNQDAIAQLSRINPPPFTDTRNLMVQRGWVQEFGGFMAKKNRFGINQHILGALLKSPEVNLTQIPNYLNGMLTSIEAMWGQIASLDITSEILRLDVPVAFFIGRQDYTIPPQVAESFLRTVESSKSKKIVWFENSAHVPQITEKDKFISELINL